jgi:hypothetical protein
VGVAGDSAGGLIAASVCHTIKGLDFQVTILYSISIFRFLINRFLFMVDLILLVEQNHIKNLLDQNMS